MSLTSPHQDAEHDDLDDILNGIVEGRDIASTDHAETRTDSESKRPNIGDDGLGIDEEIIITKKRIPIPKLDDIRLLSDPGIPRLRKISKERLRFKGKGHEYGDIARMLNMYQLWLDDLYPRAKFADALAMVEKVGHTKRMQMMRKDWIDEGKPRRTTEREDEDIDNIVLDEPTARLGTETIRGEERRGETSELRSGDNVYIEPGSHALHSATNASSADPDEDELDALLAQSSQASAPHPQQLPLRANARDDDLFADEMEAMADMEDMW